jgi:hypothetical protein
MGIGLGSVTLREFHRGCELAHSLRSISLNGSMPSAARRNRLPLHNPRTCEAAHTLRAGIQVYVDQHLVGMGRLARLRSSRRKSALGVVHRLRFWMWRSDLGECTTDHADCIQVKNVTALDTYHCFSDWAILVVTPPLDPT